MTNEYAHAQLRRVVSGAVEDAFKMHPDYLTPKGRHSAKESVVKRVSGTVLSFAEQAAKGQRELALKATQPSQAEPQVSTPLGEDAGAGDLLSSAPLPHCRIGKITIKAQTAEVADLRDELFAERIGRKLLEDLVNSRRLQSRDAAGRFVSKRGLMRQQMADACSNLTPEQRAAAKNRALSKASS